MRRFLVPLLTLLLASSCSLGLLGNQDDDLENAGDFNAIDLGISGDWNALIMTDTHVGRKAEKYPDNFQWFKSWYENNKSEGGIEINLILHLGDLTDDSAKSQYLEAKREYLESLSDTYAYFVGSATTQRTVPAFFTPGNHDVRDDGRDHFLSTCGQSEWRVVIGDVSLYGLDSGRRFFGGTQIDKLESALRSDSGKKLFFSHMPLSDQDIRYTYLTLTNEEERARLIHDMAKYKVSAFIDGHRHMLIGPYDITSDIQEISLSCLNGPNLLDDQPPCWYILHYDSTMGKATLTQYKIESEESTLSPKTKEVMTISF